MVARGVSAGAEVTGKWAEQLVEAVSGRDTESGIRAAIAAAGNRFDMHAFAQVVEEQLLRGIMLGALDVDWEIAHEEEVAPAKFSEGQPSTAVTHAPFAEAIEGFRSRQIMPRKAFDALEAGAKRRAFTIAGLAKQELLDTAHAELLRQIENSPKTTHRDPDTGVWVYEGPNFREFKTFVRERLQSAGWTPDSASHVETIFRTNVMTAYASGRFQQMRSPEVVKRMPYWQIGGVKDDRQRETHKKAQGILLPAGHPFWTKAFPPFGYNCFLPGTVVRGLFRGASRAMYAGKAIELTTAKGRRLSVTANHPILTTRGFLRARELREGDQLVSYLDEPRVESLRHSAQGNKDHAPATVEEVFRALSEAGGPLFTSAAAGDFHGEAKRFRGEIEVVGSYANLPREWDPASDEEVTELEFEPPHASSLGASPRLAPGHVVSLSASGTPGGAALSLQNAAVAVHRAPFETLRIATPAELHAVLTEQAAQGSTRDTQLAGELLQRGATHVALDEIRHVREFEFCGHVFDFETANGWLAANGVVASNCRCRVVARSQAWVDRNGASIGPEPQGLPDPGFDAGTHQLITAPASTQEPEPPKAIPAPPPASTVAPLPLPPLPHPPALFEPTTELGRTILGEKLAGPSGSNPGGVYRGTDDVQRYVKFYSDPGQALGEHLANQIYGDLGLGAVKSNVFVGPHGGLGYASEIVPGAQTLASKLTKANAKKALKGIVADVLTANWDAAGLGLDNMVVDATGNVLRIDNGGALLSRANAGRKPLEALNGISELENFFNPSVNPGYARLAQAAGVGGPEEMLPQLRAGVKKLRAFRESLGPGGWREYAEKHAKGMTALDKERIATMLEARTRLLEEKIAQLSLPKPKVKGPVGPEITKAEIERARKQYGEKVLKAGAYAQRHPAYAELRDYTASGYEQLNKFLLGERLHSSESDKAAFLRTRGQLNELLHGAAEAGHAVEGVIFRGIGLLPEKITPLVEGRSFKWESFNSSTVKEDTASNFAAGKATVGRKAVVFRIRQASGVPIEDVSFFPAEREALLPSGFSGRVLKNHGEVEFGGNRVTLIDVEETK